MSAFKSFQLKVVSRILLITFLGSAATYIVTSTYFWMVGLWLYLFFILAIIELIRFVMKVKEDLTSFLISIQQQDFSGKFGTTSTNLKDIELAKAFQTITLSFQRLREEKESNYHFLQSVIEHSTIPMLAFQADSQEINLINEAAKSLLRMPYLKNIKGIKKVNKELFQAMTRLESGEKELVKLMLHNELHYLSVSAKELVLRKEAYKLISIQNIKSELDEKELESWQKLIRVLTHEIKNSAIPISTLSEVVNQLITDSNGNLKDLSQLDQEDLDDLFIGIKTVEKRSKGLVKFVNAYGKLAKVPEPKQREIDSKKLIDDVLMLFSNQLKESSIQVDLAIKNITLVLDTELIEQVLINLIKNAIEAMSESTDRKLTIQVFEQEQRPVIAITDTGKGIAEDQMENIFIPFFTTKKEGSGIGLSLSKQIMRAHKGNLSVTSTYGHGSTFYLSF